MVVSIGLKRQNLEVFLEQYENIMNIRWKYTTRIKWTSCISRMIPLLQLYQIFFLKPVCYQGFGDVWDPVSTWTVRTKNGTLIETTLRQSDVFHLYPWMACPWHLYSSWNSHHSHRFANINWCKSSTLEQRRFWFHCGIVLRRRLLSNKSTQVDFSTSSTPWPSASCWMWSLDYERYCRNMVPISS